MSLFIDLALKRTSVVNVIFRATGGSRDDACVFYCEVDGLTLRRLARSWFDARLWRARDIVPFV